MAVLPKQGISVTLVKNTLGAGSNSIGSLCTNASVNMFSKYKPVSFSHDFTDEYPQWWKDNTGRCGIIIPRISELNEIETANWSYDRPKGGAASPFRLGDFRGYNHNAYPIIRSMYKEGIEINKAATTKLGMMFEITSSSETNLGIADIRNPALADLYTCAEIVNSSGVVRAGVTSADKLGIDGSLIDIDISNLSEGDYTMYLFLTDTKRVQGGVAGSRNMYALYHDAGHIVKVPVKVVSYSLVIFKITGLGNSLRGIYTDPKRFLGGDLALGTQGEVALKCELSAKGSTGGSYAVSSLSASIGMTYFNTPYNCGLNGCVFDSSFKAVSEVGVQGGETKVYYISGSFLNRMDNGAIGSPGSHLRIDTSLRIMGAGSYLGGTMFIATTDGNGAVRDPGELMPD